MTHTHSSTVTSRALSRPVKRLHVRLLVVQISLEVVERIVVHVVLLMVHCHIAYVCVSIRRVLQLQRSTRPFISTSTDQLG